MKLPKDLLLKASYPFTCPCGQQWYARPSMLMNLGSNFGRINCRKCGTLLMLQIALPANDEMLAENYLDWQLRQYKSEHGEQ